MLRQFPSIGHYFIVCWTVTKIILLFVTIFIFIIVGFVFGFHMM